MKKILILLQLQDFERIKLRGGMKIVSVFPFLYKNNWHLKAAIELFCKKGFLRCAFAKEFEVFWIVSSRGTLTKLRAPEWDIDMFWSIIWRRTNSSTLAKWTVKLGALVKIYIITGITWYSFEVFACFLRKLHFSFLSLTNRYL